MAKIRSTDFFTLGMGITLKIEEHEIDPSILSNMKVSQLRRYSGIICDPSKTRLHDSLYLFVEFKKKNIGQGKNAHSVYEFEIRLRKNTLQGTRLGKITYQCCEDYKSLSNLLPTLIKRFTPKSKEKKIFSFLSESLVLISYKIFG